MEIREFREGDVLVIAPEGSVAGSEETSMIETKLGTVIKAGSRLLVLDCADVRQLTGPAIRVLLMTSRKLERAEGRLVLCGMNAKVKKAFSISGFDKDFIVVATREEAVRRVMEPVPARPRSPAKISPAKGSPTGESTPPPALPAVQTPAQAPEAPPPPAPDLREGLADALLDALGVHVVRSEPARFGRDAPSDPDALASAILDALQVGLS